MCLWVTSSLVTYSGMSFDTRYPTCGNPSRSNPASTRTYFSWLGSPEAAPAPPPEAKASNSSSSVESSSPPLPSAAAASAASAAAAASLSISLRPFFLSLLNTSVGHPPLLFCKSIVFVLYTVAWANPRSMELLLMIMASSMS